MKKFWLLFLLVSCMSCVKKIEQKKTQDYIVQIMTSGQWKITSFIKGGADLSSNYKSYKFQFNTDKTLNAYNSITLENKGTWAGDYNTATITTNFQNPTANLALLVGTWQITNSSTTAVDAQIIISGELRTIRLDKI